MANSVIFVLLGDLMHIILICRVSHHVLTSALCSGDRLGKRRRIRLRFQAEVGRETQP